MALLSYDLVQDILEVADVYTAQQAVRLGRMGGDAVAQQPQAAPAAPAPPADRPEPDNG